MVMRICRGYSLPWNSKEMALTSFSLPPLCHWVCIYQNAVCLFVFRFVFLYINRLRLNDWRVSPWPVKLRWLWKIIHKMAGFSLLVIEHSVSACSEASFERAAIESRPDSNCVHYDWSWRLLHTLHFNVGHVFIFFSLFCNKYFLFLHWQMQTALELKNSNTWRTLFTR